MSFYVDPPSNLPYPVTARVILARHASHEEVGVILSGRSEIALNDAGRAEAQRLASYLAEVPIDAIHTSPRRRARETAAPIAAARALSVTPADALDEIDFGGWTGRAFSDLDGDPHWHSWNAARGAARVPDGESMAEAVDRAAAHVERTAAGGGATVFVTHCDVIRGLVARYLGMPLDNLLRFAVDPASITTLAFDGGGARLLTLNECAR